jgi:L-cysteine/cystine lyase
MRDDATAFRAAFPVLERKAYLNAGTCGPVPAAAADAAAAAAREEAAEGRSGHAHFERLAARAEELRAGYARWLGCEAADVALTTSTTAGVNVVVSALALRPGDEVVTSDEEHPGLLAPLALAARRRGIEVRVAPFGSIAEAVSERTRLVACSHVSWVSGQVVDTAALAACPAPVLLDGAQALGTRELDMAALGCDFYAASGQKWLCGPEGTGCLYVRRDRLEELAPPIAGYGTLADPLDPLGSELRPGAARLDLAPGSAMALAWALAALEVLDGPGRAWVVRRATTLAARLADALGERGREVLPRGDTTLVSWRDDDAAQTVARLAGAGVVVRDLPGRALVRASVGAWTSEADLERLLELVAP